MLCEDATDGKSYTEYTVQVHFHNGKEDQVPSWTVQKRYKSFCQLHEALVSFFPTVQFPQSSCFAQRSHHEPISSAFPGSGGESKMADRRGLLDQYLRELLMIPCVKESNIFKAFIGIDKLYPEFYNASMDKVSMQAKVDFAGPAFDLASLGLNIPHKQEAGHHIKLNSNRSLKQFTVNQRYSQRANAESSSIHK